MNKHSLCYKPQCLSAFACRMSGNRNLSGNGCVSKRTSEITKRGETPWGWRRSTGRNSKVLPLGWDLCLIPWSFFLFVELRFTCYVNFVIIDCFTVYSSVAFGAVPYCTAIISQFSSVQFSRSVVSDSLGPHGLQHTRPPCPSPTPGVHPDPRPSSQ